MIRGLEKTHLLQVDLCQRESQHRAHLRLLVRVMNLRLRRILHAISATTPVATVHLRVVQMHMVRRSRQDRTANGLVMGSMAPLKVGFTAMIRTCLLRTHMGRHLHMGQWQFGSQLLRDGTGMGEEVLTAMIRPGVIR